MTDDHSNSRGPQPDRTGHFAAWDRSARTNATVKCSHEGCGHSAQQRYPGLTDGPPDFCPIHKPQVAHDPNKPPYFCQACPGFPYRVDARDQRCPTCVEDNNPIPGQETA